MTIGKKWENVAIFIVEYLHLTQTPPSFVSEVSLILDIVIVSYSITHFSILSLFYSTGETVSGDKPGGASPHQTAGNARNGSSLRSDSPSAQKRGYGKRTAVDSTVANTGISFFFVLFCLNRLVCHSLSPTDPLWRQPPAHGTTAAMPLPPTLIQARHPDTKHPGCPGLWTGEGHSGGGTWEVRRYAPDGDENPDGGIIPQLTGLQHDFLVGTPL